MDTIYFTSRFPRLRAMWAIWRDGAVIWNVDMAEGSVFTTKAGKVARGIVALRGLTIGGVPIELSNLSPAPCEGQEDTTAIGADEDVEAQ